MKCKNPKLTYYSTFVFCSIRLNANANVYFQTTFMCQRSIAGVPFDSVRCFLVTLLLRTTCMRLWCNGVPSCVAETKNSWLPLTHGFWWGNIVNMKPLNVVGVLSIKVHVGKNLCCCNSCRPPCMPELCRYHKTTWYHTLWYSVWYPYGIVLARFLWYHSVMVP